MSASPFEDRRSCYVGQDIDELDDARPPTPPSPEGIMQEAHELLFHRAEGWDTQV